MKSKKTPFTTGENIRRLRILKGFKQFGAGIKLGIGQQGYSKMECSPGLSKAKTMKILKAFNSNIEELDLITRFTPPPIILVNFVF